MKNYSKMPSYDLIKIFDKIMSFDEDDLNKDVYNLKKSYPNDFWKIYREIEYRNIYKKENSNKVFVGIVGTRSRNDKDDYYLVSEIFTKLFVNLKNIVIVSGLCSKGGDRFAVLLYQKYRTEKLWFPAEWYLGKHAGFVRNTEIARWSDYLIACVDPKRKGGTEDTIKKWENFHKDNPHRLYIV